jgi:hypothetical protein
LCAGFKQRSPIHPPPSRRTFSHPLLREGRADLRTCQAAPRSGRTSRDTESGGAHSTGGPSRRTCVVSRPRSGASALGLGTPLLARNVVQSTMYIRQSWVFPLGIGHVKSTHTHTACKVPATQHSNVKNMRTPPYTGRRTIARSSLNFCLQLLAIKPRISAALNLLADERNTNIRQVEPRS